MSFWETVKFLHWQGVLLPLLFMYAATTILGTATAYWIIRIAVRHAIRDTQSHPPKKVKESVQEPQLVIQNPTQPTTTTRATLEKAWRELHAKPPTEPEDQRFRPPQ